MSEETVWSVLEHDPPTPLGEHVWYVHGALPSMSIRRTMVVVALPDGGLVLHNPIALDEAGMAWLAEKGEPRWLIVPNGMHRLDTPRYKARFPEAQVLCPAGSRAKVEAKVPVDHPFGEVSIPGGRVELVHLDGLREAEGVMIAHDPAGTTLVFNDALFNVHDATGLFATIYGRWMGNFGRPKVTTIARWLLIKDRPAFRAHLERLSEIEGLAAVVPGHGRVITDDPARVLRMVAAEL